MGSRPRLADSLCQVIAAYALRLNSRADTECSTVSSFICDRCMATECHCLFLLLLFYYCLILYKLRSDSLILNEDDDDDDVDVRKCFFAERVLKPWNNLPAELHHFSSLSVFKRFIFSVDLPEFVTC